MTSTTTKPTQTAVSSTYGLWGGILFSLAFTLLIWLLGSNLYPVDLEPDRPGMWYAWMLRHPTFWTRTTAWVGYTLHQLTIWGLLYYAQAQKPRYSQHLHRFNLLALAANAIFITLHLVQTHLWYDGLAQDVPEWTSQWSVILLLVIVLLMENQRRGLVVGKKVPFLTEAGRTLRQYHGYYFAWAIIYTFWYHPMEFTSGHLLGFFYMFLLMLQGSLFYTRAHINPWWMVVQELFVLFHGTMVSLMNDDGGWAMFLFGFFGLFVVTQMYGLPLTKWQRGFFWVSYVGSMLVTYSLRGWDKWSEPLRIPVAEYLLVFVIALLVMGAMRFQRLATNGNE